MIITNHDHNSMRGATLDYYINASGHGLTLHLFDVSEKQDIQTLNCDMLISQRNPQKNDVLYREQNSIAGSQGDIEMCGVMQSKDNTKPHPHVLSVFNLNKYPCLFSLFVQIIITLSEDEESIHPVSIH